MTSGLYTQDRDGGRAMPTARAGRAAPGAGSRLRHPATITIAAIAVWLLNIATWWIV